MYKVFYCKSCRDKVQFISHADLPNNWVCCTCQTRTSNPLLKAPRKRMPRREVEFEVIIKKKESMSDFWKKMVEKSC